MAELGYATLPRGMRIPTLSFGHFSNGHLSNGHAGGTAPNSHPAPPHVPVVSINSSLSNGSLTANGTAGGRAVHDGFATIRSGGSKRGRARSSPSVVGENRGHHQCHHGCCPTLGRTWAMEPLWEEKCSVEPSGAPQVTRRERQQLPWWEIATRRSRYRSCPAFSQASVVNALEQTMSNVTNRLERLASSPDLKESEAAELRKTAAVLRQQSSAVCQSVSSGYLTMERQLSCDSVSSVTSTISGASLSSFASMPSRSVPGTLSQHFGHNQFHQNDTLNSSDNNKIKKRSWLRSSFRRAFGRHSRKRSKQTAEGNREESHELPMHHTVNSAVKHLSPPPPPPSYCTLMKPHSTLKSFSKEATKQKQDNVIKDEHQSSQEENNLITRLQKDLADKERELTDCRLEVLSTQHQLQSQADTITRLQAEVTGLREENNKLLSLIRGQCNSTTDALLTPLSHTLTALTLNPGSTSGNNVALVSGRQVKVMVVEQSDLATVNTSVIINLKPSYLTHIGNINVESKTTWEEFDKLIANTVKDYGNRIDPVSALGLESDSILCYRVDEIVRAPDLPLPELLPYGYFVGNVDALHVWIKGGNHKKDAETVGDVSLAAFSSVTPASSLKRLASQLTEHRRLLLAGPPACGKSSLAETLAQFFVTNSTGEYSSDAIKTFKVTGSNTLELCQLLSSMWPRSSLASSSQSTSSMSSSISISSSSLSSSITSPDDSSTPPCIIIIDDLHLANGVVETLLRCLPTSVHVGPAIIATCCPTSTLATRLHINCNFKWATLSIQQEPVRGLLGRVLRRRVVAAEVAANTRLPDAHHLAEWLTRLWLHLNTLLSGHCSSHEVGVGPGLLMDSPLGQEETQVWFTEVWNTRLVPYIKETLRTSSSPNANIFDTWTDPLDWVLATYPWPVNAACGPDQLIRITASDIGKQEGGLLNRKLSEPYVPLSVRQQIRKAESIYSTPQLLPLGGLPRPHGTHGTGQTVLSKDIQTVNPYQPSKLEENIERKESPNTVYGSHNNGKVFKDYEINENVKSETVIDRSESGSDKVLSNSRNSLDNLGENHQDNKTSSSNISESSKTSHSPVSLEENERNEKHGVEKMESEQFPEKNCKSVPSIYNGYVNSFTNNTIDCKDVVMDTDCNSEHYENSTNLNILAKNAINSNGLTNDCVKIIRETGPKIDLRDLSHELTSTFKPAETAM
ncbi:neuron navigator 2-like [Palaemon carinicauda]|uniref:neuron navigator 2-like n=1 Tax=Palaemon carinicauda TaxID=392227 RepID=UPI0035B5FA8F